AILGRYIAEHPDVTAPSSSAPSSSSSSAKPSTSSSAPHSSSSSARPTTPPTTSPPTTKPPATTVPPPPTTKAPPTATTSGSGDTLGERFGGFSMPLERVQGLSTADIEHQADLMVELNGGWQRGDYQWSQTEPSEGVFRWDDQDRWIKAALTR